jgi:hypothetical protein
VTFDLSRLVPGARVVLPGSGEEVRLLTVTAGPFYDLFYEAPGGLGRVTLAEDELAGISHIDAPDLLPFDADPALFRLGIEARRIQVSFAHDMAALAVSNIQPLPHQIEAVYDCFLREPRVRFLLADDPGAGKTIMAGLYMKELANAGGGTTAQRAYRPPKAVGTGWCPTSNLQAPDTSLTFGLNDSTKRRRRSARRYAPISSPTDGLHQAPMKV